MPRRSAPSRDFRSSLPSSRGSCPGARFLHRRLRAFKVRLEIILPQIDAQGVAARRVLAPQLTRGEADGVDMLRAVAAAMRVAVGENIRSPVTFDDASLPAHIARQARMSGDIKIACDDAIANPKACAPAPDLRRVSSEITRWLNRSDRTGAARSELIATKVVPLHE